MRNRKYLITIIAFVVLYIIQFIIFPVIAPRCFPQSNESVGLYFGSILLHLIVLECFISNKVKTWIIGNIVYHVLVVIYHGRGLYGIGLRGIDLDGARASYDFEYVKVYILFEVIYLIILEIIVKLVSLLARKIFGLKLPTYNEPPVEQ